MGFGLIEFKESDKALEYVPLYRSIYTAFFVGTFYLAANRYHFFARSNQLKASLAVFTALSMYYSKGLALHTAGLFAVDTKNTTTRNNELESYQRNHHKSSQ
jgi:hypothetical protein